ncbi:TPA: hypothetical protein EYP75_05490 [Candidatus Bathyarchaeota archaeon]|nr:hypothetical protein [Candidatus Bathyarchaeota archaeon]
MTVTVSEEVRGDFPNLHVLTIRIEKVIVKKSNSALEEFKRRVFQEILDTYDIENLKDRPILRAYRDFFWKLGVDPTKTRPAAEALIRRLLRGKPLPLINTLVDAYNLASIKTEIAIAAFDSDRIRGKLMMRYADMGEEFLGIGMKKPLRLNGREIVISDEEKLLAIYPYRDAEDTKVTEATRNLLLLFCGVPGIPMQKLLEAKDVTLKFVTKFCGGIIKDKKSQR